jgi:hypothetical protein
MTSTSRSKASANRDNCFFACSKSGCGTFVPTSESVSVDSVSVSLLNLLPRVFLGALK